MQTTYIAGTKLREDDEDLVRALGKPKRLGLGKTMRIGIRNSDGVIYRKIETTGVRNYLHAIDCLLEREFINELEDAPGPQGGYDAIFRK